MASVVEENNSSDIYGYLLLVGRRFSAKSGKRDRFSYPPSVGSGDRVEYQVPKGRVLRFGPGDEDEIVSFLTFYQKIKNPALLKADFWRNIVSPECTNKTAYKGWPVSAQNQKKNFELRKINVCIGSCGPGHRCIMGRDGLCSCVNTEDPLQRP